jgi:predicted ATPase
MAGERAVLFATDPPYAVGYTGLSHPQSWNNRGANKDWSHQYMEARSADVKNAEDENMLESIRTYRSVGQDLFADYAGCVLAEAYLLAGRVKEGMAIVDEVITSSAAREQRFCEAETHRLKGEFLLLSGARDDAEKSMRAAIAIARRQEAKSWELRATTSLARLLRETNRRDEARAMLADVYNWFTEGFDTADLKDAKALLEELG